MTASSIRSLTASVPEEEQEAAVASTAVGRKSDDDDMTRKTHFTTSALELGTKGPLET
jgi:hypothetical protein